MKRWREEKDKISYLQYRSIVVKDKNNVREINIFQFINKVLSNKAKITPDTNFESMFFNPFSIKESFVDNEQDPDVNFYHDLFMLDIQYLTPDKFKKKF